MYVFQLALSSLLQFEKEERTQKTLFKMQQQQQAPAVLQA
jgi:hypothetical protein